MKEYYEMTIAGLKRQLPICEGPGGLVIAGFVIFGDVELTEACAKALLEKAPEFDVLIAPEAKSIPLIYEIAKQCGMNDYLIARKKMKLYMKDAFSTEVQSITTAGTQHLYLSGEDAAKLKGKRVCIIDDVISTGESLAGVEKLVNEAGGNIVAKLAILAEGKAAERSDITFLEPLPLFDSNGDPIK